MTLKIAFTSCMDAKRCPDQPVWAAVQNEQPDVLLLLGDQIYMDWGLSLAKTPASKRAFRSDPAEAQKAFAEDMHARYKAQWDIASFRACICALKAANKKLLVMWDEHDFAWNNAYGAGHDERWVPPELQRIAQALFHQFRTVLEAGQNRDYPAMPSAEEVAVAQPPGYQAIDLGHDVRLVLLDQRTYRTQRDDPNAQLLRPRNAVNPDKGDLELLIDEINANHGLLVVAGSSPLRHRYLLGDQGWWAPPKPGKPVKPDGTRAYPEYRQFLNAAQASNRPVLYLAGDIHRNSYGGPVEESESHEVSPVVQVLSSGAALGHVLLRRFPGSFATVTLHGKASQGELQIDFHEVGKAKTTAASLALAGGHWSGLVPRGECLDAATDADHSRYVGDLSNDPQAQPLAVMCFRQRGGNGSPDALLVSPDALNDDAFTDAPPSQAVDWPEFVNVASSRQQDGKLHIMRSSLTNRVDPVATGIAELFDRAGSQGRSVVLFIHGFNKSFSGSLDQALQLRARFPQCEPLLYSWPTGAEGGFRSLFDGFVRSWQVAEMGARSLNAALGQFCLTAMSRPNVPAVVVARSLGSEALRLASGALQLAQAAALRRVVLSAPAAALSQHKKWVEALKCPEVVVTINRNDNRLKYVTSWSGHRKPLGNHTVDAHDRAANARYLDLTDVDSVLVNHDHLLRPLNAALIALNDDLLQGKPIDFAQLPARVPGLVVY